MLQDIRIVAFDADDTLWVNEPLFQETERKFCEMMEDFLPHHTVSRELLKTEIQNMSNYGYGIKSFLLSMIETAIKISDGAIETKEINKIIELGKEMMNAPVEVIEGVEEVLESIQGKYRLVMATKGDLLDQERKLEKSGLAGYFHHIEIVSEKKEPQYKKLIKHLDIEPAHFLMIGNSIKSDILPVLNLGGHGFHVPFHTTWELEVVDKKIEHENFRQLEKVTDVLKFLN